MPVDPAVPTTDPALPRPAARVVSGVQPSGELHLGNYFGAIQRHVALQNDPRVGECFFFIANFHSLTSTRDRAALRDYTTDLAVSYLALGLDPARTVFYRQSDVPEVAELMWMLACVTGMGLLEKAHSYKDKVAKGLHANAGLFTYPLLMAADILGPQADLVPVGGDQQQHVELTRDFAAAFNAAFCADRAPVFRLPEPRIEPALARIPGTTFDKGKVTSDGKRVAAKMSKSYGNTISLFAEGKALKKQVMRIETDVTALEDPLDPDDDLVMQLYKLFATPAEIEEMRANYLAGGYGYGRAKGALLEKIDGHFAPFRERRKQLLADPDTVEEILRDGARRARPIFQQTLAAARDATGIPPLAS